MGLCSSPLPHPQLTFPPSLSQLLPNCPPGAWYSFPRSHLWRHCQRVQASQPSFPSCPWPLGSTFPLTLLPRVSLPHPRKQCALPASTYNIPFLWVTSSLIKPSDIFFLFSFFIHFRKTSKYVITVCLSVFHLQRNHFYLSFFLLFVFFCVCFVVWVGGSQVWLVISLGFASVYYAVTSNVTFIF